MPLMGHREMWVSPFNTKKIVATQMQAEVTIYYHCIVFLLPFNGNTCCKCVMANLLPVLDLGLISIASLGPMASTKVESHVNFTVSRKV